MTPAPGGSPGPHSTQRIDNVCRYFGDPPNNEHVSRHKLGAAVDTLPFGSEAALPMVNRRRYQRPTASPPSVNCQHNLL